MADFPLFKVPLADLEYGDKDLDEPIPVEWLRSAFEGTEAVPNGPGSLELTLSKSGREVMARGRARAEVTMPCARTLDPVVYPLESEVFLLLTPRSAAQPAARPERARKAGAAARPGKPGSGEKKGPTGGKPGKPGKHGKGKDKDAEDALLSDSDAARDTYDGENVVLDPFIKEFLVLELPMFPLREDLRSEDTPAIERPPEPVEGRSRGEALDPRLAPLADIAKRLREKKE
ncbi:MAG TPA: hypothetical protein VHE30_29855 [Polyangiaceae bacterium]|nr:hypothetical protein [Polyangiaceae bacterium]